MSRFVSLGRYLPVALLSSLAVSLVLLAPSLAETSTGKKYALLVGVRAYKHRDLDDLKYTENDVEELAKALKGFTEVVVLTSTRGETKAAAAPTAANVRKQLKVLLDKVSKHDTIVVALAGHGLQLKVKVTVKDPDTGKVKEKETDEGFFCPADARPRKDATLAEQSKTMLGFTELFQELQESGVGVKLLLVDACRNDPAAGRSVNADAMPRAPKGMAALFSCRSGERAFETDKLGAGHGIFFHYVIAGLKGEAKNRRGDVTWDALAEYVKDKVSDEVPLLIKKGAKQTPEEIKKLEGKAPVLVAAGTTAVVADKGREKPGKEEIVKEKGDKEISNSIGMKLVRIPAGTFTMGSTDHADESPKHGVKITKAFYLGVYPVTQAEYAKIMGENPSYFSADGDGKVKVKGMNTSRFPVERVSWEDAVKFCKKLSEMAKEKAAKRTYRLPTEAEWEYACRAGTTTKYYSGDDEDDLKEVGWYSANSGSRTHNVGQKKPNKFGLYDMHGNVYQWCSDWYGEDYYKESDKEDPEGPKGGACRVLRGGGWYFAAGFCRAANRIVIAPGFRNNIVFGFRVVCVAAGTR